MAGADPKCAAAEKGMIETWAFRGLRHDRAGSTIHDRSRSIAPYSALRPRSGTASICRNDLQGHNVCGAWFPGACRTKRALSRMSPTASATNAYEQEVSSLSKRFLPTKGRPLFSSLSEAEETELRSPRAVAGHTTVRCACNITRWNAMRGDCSENCTIGQLIGGAVK